MSEGKLLEVNDLSVRFGERTVVQDLGYTMHPGSTLAVVGASGSGKSISSLALMGLLPENAIIDSGTAYLQTQTGKQELFGLSEKEHRRLRGKEMAMIFQEPMTALNPVYRCGQQVAEMIRTHENVSRGEARAKVIALFEQVHLPNPTAAYDKFPHQMSGGQKQRVMIAMAMSCSPQLLIADEPTTALDVVVQKEILELLDELQTNLGMGMLFITHDLGVVQDIADEVLVMHEGQVVERGSVTKVLSDPQENYTKGLLGSRPPLDSYPVELPTVQQYLKNEVGNSEIISSLEKRKQAHALTTQEPILKVRKLNKTFFDGGGLFRKTNAYAALKNIELEIYPGETLGLVGGSGSGKTTLGRTLLQLIRNNSGTVEYNGIALNLLNEKELRRFRKDIQIIFQDPYSSLNPRIQIGAAMMEVMRVHNIADNDAERKKRIEELLVTVGLEAAHYNRYPHEFSGGQRQRVVIARTLCMDPKLIICDESVSALDVSVQAQVLNLLNKLKKEHGLTYVFISHDMAVVRYMSDRMVVLEKGEIVEVGIADEVFETPNSKASIALIDAIPGRL